MQQHLQLQVQRAAIATIGHPGRAGQPVEVRPTTGGLGPTSSYRRGFLTVGPEPAPVRTIAAAAPTGGTGPTHVAAVLAPLAMLMALAVRRMTCWRAALPAISRTVALRRPRGPPRLV
jgi:hypothetical protein